MTSRPEKGDKAPNVTLPSSLGKDMLLRKPFEKARVIFFYPKDNTPGCTTEAKDFSRLKSKFEALGVDLVGVSKDSLKSHENFITKQDLGIPLASDKDSNACEAFGVWVEKNMYGRTYMGIERSTFLILADGTIEEIWRKVKVKGHAEQVLAATQHLLS